MSINLLFDNFWIPDGGELYIYNEDRSKVSLMNFSNNKGLQFSRRGNASDIIYGKSIYLEYYKPKGTLTPNLSIKYIVQGYRYIEQLYSEHFNSSGDCQVNINCPEGNNWQQEKNAIAMIIVNGHRYCTGALIKSLGNNRKLFLTADHCLGGWANNVKYDAQSNNILDYWTFWWNYESPTCQNTNSISNYIHTSGAKVLANNNLTDFALLELDEDPADKTCKIYYLGWDRQNPTVGGVGIHHPAGDVKKISTYNIIPQTVNNNNFHRIYWSQTQNGHSVTEGGSSGSPLLNNNKRIIGQLYGGNHINCVNPSQDNGDYGKFSVSWSSGNSSSRRLKDWLDPNNTNLLYTNGESLNCPSDLVIKDNSTDTGAEPNDVQYFWESPDIWIRNYNDSSNEHQNPIYKSNNLPNFIKVRVKNNGGVASTGYEKLKIYWAKASTALSYPNPWHGGIYQEGNTNLNALMGSPLDSIYIPILQPNEETILTVPWVVPNPYVYIPETNNQNDRWHFCLLARIEADNDPMYTTETTDLATNVRNNNNIAQKNVTVSQFSNFLYGGAIAVGNHFNISRTFNLVFKSIKTNDKYLSDEAEVHIELSDVVFNAWKNGGFQSEDVRLGRKPKTIVLMSENAKLKNLQFAPNKVGAIAVNIHYLTQAVSQESYTLLVKQTDENDKIVGGETFNISRSPRDLFYAQADDKEVNKNETVVLSAEDINETAIYNWYDSEGNLVHEGANFETSVDIAKTYKLEIIATIDGYKDYKDVEVSLKSDHIVTVYPNPLATHANISYKINNATNAYLSITGVYGSNVANNYILDINQNNITIDMSSYPAGIYTVSLIANGSVVDQMSIIKQ